MDEPKPTPENKRPPSSPPPRSPDDDQTAPPPPDEPAGPGPEKPAEPDAADLIGQANASPGESSRTADGRRRTAGEWNLRDVDGDVVAGDKYVIEGRRRARIKYTRVEDGGIETTIRTFVEPTGLDEVRTCVGEHRVTLVRAPRGTGRRTAALCVLSGLAPEQPIYLLDPATDLRDLDATHLPKGAAFLLTDVPRPFDAPDFDLDRIAAELTGRDGRLVVTVNSAHSLPQYGDGTGLVDLNPHPAPELILHKHIRFRLRAAADQAEDLIGRPDLAELVTQYLGEGCRLTDVVKCAELVTACPPDVVSLTEEVGPLLDERHDGAFGNWFPDLPTLRTKCMAISLAVLGGLQHETVATAADSLLEKVDPLGRQRQRLDAPDPFRDSKQQELDLLDAVLEPGWQTTPFGDVAAEFLRFRRPKFGSRLFLYVWKEYRDVREPIAEWLRELGSDPVPGVRLQAAGAVGALATKIFDPVYAKLLAPWAGSEDPWEQDAAATAVAVAADEPELLPVLRSLVRDWEQRDEVELRQTAARAYGAQLGVLDPPGTLRALRRLAEDESVALRRTIAGSLGELMATDSEVFGSEVLKMLYDWGRTRPHRLDFAGRFAFLILAVDLIRTDPQDKQETWPGLLWIGTRSKASHQQLAWLWWSALNASDLYRPARDVLDGWATRCERNEPAAEALFRLLREVACDQRTTDIITRAAERWRADNGEAPTLGARVLNGVGR